MRTKKLLHKILYVVAAFVLSLFVVFEYTFSKMVNANAATANGYSSVLDDLHKDSSFKESDYPARDNDYSLSVIQIAESVDGELFIYAYQPSDNTLDFVGTYISMYLGESVNGEDFKPTLYEISLISTQGVFDKYVVNDFKVSTEAYRYYNIVSIYRPYSAIADGKDLSIGNTEEIAYKVGQQWCAYTYNDVTTYEMNTFKTVEIEVTANGYVTFEAGFSWGNFVGMSDDCDAHFIAFNFEDYKVPYIYDADLSYRVRKKTRSVGIGHSGEWEYGEYSEPINVTLKATDEAVFKDGAIKETTYKWNRISSSTDFVNMFESQNGELYESDRETILSSQWVFAFCETENDFVSGMGLSTWYEYDVEDVAILRIHFRDISGKIYNLGVVANITDSADNPSGIAKSDDDWPDWVYWILFGLLFVVGASLVTGLVVVAGPFFKLLKKGISFVFGLIGKFFKALGKTFRRKK